MTIESRIEAKLASAFELSHLQVINESHNHNVPPGSESHFKVIVVAESFKAVGLLQRHKQINKILADELQNQIHALAIHAYTEEEWRQKFGVAPLSPPCLGGSIADSAANISST